MASNLAASDGAIGGCPEAAAAPCVGVFGKLGRTLRMSRPEAWWRADGSEMDEIERSTDGYCVSWNEDKSFELLKMVPKNKH